MAIPSLSAARCETSQGGQTALPKLEAWRLIKKIGVGRFCDIFAAAPWESDLDSPASYAIKILHEKWQGHSLAPLIRHRMELEIQAGHSVSHAHVVPILGGAMNHATPHLIMPLLEGSSLEKHLHALPINDLSKPLSMMRQAAQGLAALHEEAWIHGDIKPSNMMLAPSGHLTLIDLGFAHRLEEANNKMEGSPFGTLPYAAPERFQSLLAGSYQSDIYSLGIVLYEMVVGERPFTATSSAGWATAHVQSRVEDPRHRRPGLSPRLTALLLRMLAKEPLRRPEASEIIDALVAIEIEAMADWAAG